MLIRTTACAEFHGGGRHLFARFVKLFGIESLPSTPVRDVRSGKRRAFA